ncbi:type II secretion system F family protein [Streptomyces sp. NPDC005438]|uniref:type II secretion system F family protein n=1 Tax=Streptomyces sp. NPDC005438 TaxID=3156880 RepID=UPI00339DA9A5
MDISTLTIGVTLLACVTGVVGLRVYSNGKAQKQELVDRLTYTGQPPAYGRHRRFGGLDQRLKKTGLGQRIDRKIAVTGMDVTAGEYFVYVIAGVLGTYLVVSYLFAPFFGLLAAAIALWAANGFLTMQRNKRTEAFINQLPELTRVLANATQAGLALRTAIGMAAEELESPAREEFGRVANQLAVGHTLEDALGDLNQRLPSRELTVLITTLILSNRAGGTIVSSLRNLTQTLEERKETRREVTTLLAQVRVTAIAIPLLGIGFLLLINGMRAGALDDMAAATPGKIAIVLSAALYALGFFLIQRLSRVRV